MISRLVVLLCVVVLAVSDVTAQERTDNFQASWESQWEISCMIRKDKFDFVLPKAMRRNNIDMWIVIDRGRGTEPMILDLVLRPRMDTEYMFSIMGVITALSGIHSVVPAVPN